MLPYYQQGGNNRVCSVYQKLWMGLQTAILWKDRFEYLKQDNDMKWTIQVCPWLTVLEITHMISDVT